MTPLGVLSSWGDLEAVFIGERVGFSPGPVEVGKRSLSSPEVALLLWDNQVCGGQ